tara:strand:+ start:91 stop:483 length:393 start_codon:yes stop_codon:yes gene_type:complete
MNTFIQNDGGYALTNFQKRKIGNCVPRAIAIALEKSYLDVWNELMDLAKENGLFPNTERCYSYYLLKYGWHKQKPQRTANGKMRKLKYFNSKNISAIVHTRKHLVCVKNGKILDIWNPSTYKAGSYWIKI